MRFTGKTVEEAKGNACLKLEKTLKELNIRVLSEGSKGFFGIGAKPAIIEVSVIGEESEEKTKEKTQEKKSRKELKTEPARQDKKKEKKSVKKPKKPLQKDSSKKINQKEHNQESSVRKEAEPKDIDVKAPDKKVGGEKKREKNQPFKIKEEVCAYIRELTEKMGVETTTELTVDEKERQVLVNIICKQPTAIIGKRGIILDAIQTIINATFNKEKNGYWLKTDCDGYRNKRAKTIENLALRTAETVKRNKRKIYLDRLSSAERRIIHSLLQHDEQIETFSEGREPNRKLVIYYKG